MKKERAIELAGGHFFRASWDHPKRSDNEKVNKLISSVQTYGVKVTEHLGLDKSGQCLTPEEAFNNYLPWYKKRHVEEPIGHLEVNRWFRKPGLVSYIFQNAAQRNSRREDVKLYDQAIEHVKTFRNPEMKVEYLPDELPLYEPLPVGTQLYLIEYDNTKAGAGSYRIAEHSIATMDFSYVSWHLQYMPSYQIEGQDNIVNHRELLHSGYCFLTVEDARVVLGLKQKGTELKLENYNFVTAYRKKVDAEITLPQKEAKNSEPAVEF